MKDDPLRMAPPGAKAAGPIRTTRLCFDLDPTDAERLPQITKLYDLAMSQPVPDAFAEMLQWANARDAAKTEFARFLRKILDKGGILN